MTTDIPKCKAIPKKYLDDVAQTLRIACYRGEVQPWHDLRESIKLSWQLRALKAIRDCESAEDFV